MNQDERRAADELDELLSWLQNDKPCDPAAALDEGDARLATQLAQLAKSTHLDPAFAARLATRLQQNRPWGQRSFLGYWWGQWQQAMSAAARRPVFVALITLVLAASSFALFSRVRAPSNMPPLNTTLPNNALPRPRTFSEYGRAILDFLNAQPANAAALKSTLNTWGVLKVSSPTTSTWEATGDIWSADVDGNGEDDLILALLNPDRSTDDGAFMLYLKQNGVYRLAQEVRAQSRPRILYAQDLLNDGRITVVRSTGQCVADACSVMVDVLRWENNQLRSLMPAKARMEYPEISLLDSAQGVKAVVLHGGVIPAVSAGPQRARTEVYRWNGTAFALAETRYDASPYLYFKVIDANRLMQQQKYGEAIVLYQEAISNNRLQTWEGHEAAQERANLQAFAMFRMMVGYALLGDDTTAQAVHNYFPNSQPNHIYVQVADVFWQNYAPQKSVMAGCNAVTTFAQANLAVPAVLNNFGYTNPNFSADDVCPFR